MSDFVTKYSYITDSILSATDQGHISILCLIDLSKCFDVIDHEKLLEKLQLLGVDTDPISMGTLNPW